MENTMTYDTFNQRAQAVKCAGTYALIANQLGEWLLNNGSKPGFKVAHVELCVAAANGQNAVAAVANFATENGLDEINDKIVELAKYAPVIY
jgi:hypothetical protein